MRGFKERNAIYVVVVVYTSFFIDADENLFYGCIKRIGLSMTVCAASFAPSPLSLYVRVSECVFLHRVYTLLLKKDPVNHISS